MISAKIISLNLNGFGDKQHVLQSMLRDLDILCLQEHHLLDHSTSLLSSLSQQFKCFISPATPTGGRPSGGVCIFIRENIPVSVFAVNRYFVAVRIPGIIVFSCYLPTNYHTIDSDFDFNFACLELSRFVAKVPSDFQWLICGDFNCNIAISDVRSSALLSLFSVFTIVSKDADFTYVHNSGSCSNLDHVLVSNAALLPQPVHVGLDMPISDHFYLSFHLNIQIPSFKIIHRSSQIVNKMIWDREKMCKYHEESDALLAKIIVNYSKDVDQIDIDLFYLEIVHSLKVGANKAFRTDSFRRGSRVLGWNLNPILKQSQKNASQACYLWNCAGKPRSGPFYDGMKLTKRVFRAELRLHNEIIKDEIGSRITSDKNELWSLVNSRRRNNNCSPDSNSSLKLDDWITHYNQVFSSGDAAVESRLDSLLSEEISKPRPNSKISVSVDDVTVAIKALKSKHSFDHDGIHSNHIKWASPKAILLLATLFTTILSSGVLPTSFSRATTSPLSKKGGNTNRCSDYRPITVSCQISKVFELVLLKYLESCNQGLNQIGFRKGLSMDVAHTLLSRIISFCKQWDRVYTLALDFAAAYDSIIHSWAMTALLKNNVPLPVVLVLKKWYGSSRIRIKWKNQFSDYNVKLCRGLRQGSIISPLIFNITVSGLFDQIQLTFIYGKGYVLSWIAYADDLLLLSRSLQSLQQNVDFLAKVFSEHGLRFRPEKCQFLILGPKANDLVNSEISVRIYDSILKPLESFLYLGVPYGPTLALCRASISKAVKSRIASSFGAVICLRDLLSRKSLARVYNTVALPQILVFSSLLPFFRISNIAHVKTTFFNFAKFLCRFSKSESNTFLMNAYKIKNPVDVLEKKQKNFLSKLNVFSHNSYRAAHEA